MYEGRLYWEARVLIDGVCVAYVNLVTAGLELDGLPVVAVECFSMTQVRGHRSLVSTVMEVGGPLANIFRYFIS